MGERVALNPCRRGAAAVSAGACRWQHCLTSGEGGQIVQAMQNVGIAAGAKIGAQNLAHVQVHLLQRQKTRTHILTPTSSSSFSHYAVHQSTHTL